MLSTLPRIRCLCLYWGACGCAGGALYAPACAAGESRKVGHVSHVCVYGLAIKRAWSWVSVRLG